MRRVILESPLSGKTEVAELANVAYARACLYDCIKRGEAPLASHLLFPQILNDAKPEERATGMEAGFAWTPFADAVVVYADRGISKGMEMGVARAKLHNVPIEMRKLKGGSK